MASEMVTLPAEAIRDLRRMLTIGLHAYGEVESVQQEMDALRAMGNVVPDRLFPTMLSAEREVGNFAEALLWLEHAEPVAADTAEVSS